MNYLYLFIWLLRFWFEHKTFVEIILFLFFLSLYRCCSPLQSPLLLYDCCLAFVVIHSFLLPFTNGYLFIPDTSGRTLATERLLRCNCIHSTLDRTVQELPNGIFKHEIQSNGGWMKAFDSFACSRPIIKPKNLTKISSLGCYVFDTMQNIICGH